MISTKEIPKEDEITWLRRKYTENRHFIRLWSKELNNIISNSIIIIHPNIKQMILDIINKMEKEID